jgi:hypothetical protein
VENNLKLFLFCVWNIVIQISTYYAAKNPDSMADPVTACVLVASFLGMFVSLIQRPCEKCKKDDK